MIDKVSILQLSYGNYVSADDYFKLQSNWNSLRGYTKAHIEIIENKLSLIGTCNPVMASKELQIYQQYLDKMNELEGDKNE